MPSPWNEAGREPSIEEMLADPIVQLLMSRDRIGPERVLAAVAAARQNLARPAPDQASRHAA